MFYQPSCIWGYAVVSAILSSCCFLLASSAADESKYQEIFFVKPGAGKLSVQAEVKKYQCKFSYAAQGGTHEEWQLSLELLDGGTAVMCSIERGGSSSYLFFEEFEVELTGPMVSITEVDLKNSQRDNKALEAEEYKREKTSVSSVTGKFKNHLEKVAVYSPLSRDDL
ncbi:myeloid-derived growth factor [Aplysia californica]|uniref:Myeloid-derived growth factor n=1 Tax=Aplysia californica TaxID=6500 RepID=A0ABM0JLK5_APLCA|nr:myeloid-derived growth factor [Aplysia californica]